MPVQVVAGNLYSSVNMISQIIFFSGYLSNEPSGCLSLPFHEQAISVLQLRSSDYILVSSDPLYSGLCSSGDYFFRGFTTSPLLVYRAQVCGLAINRHRPLYVRGLF